MLKYFSIVFLISVILPLNIYADWVSLNGNKLPNSAPEVTLLSDDNSSSVIRIDLAGFDIKEFISDDKTYQSVDLLTEIFTNEEGSPTLPYIAKILAIPDQAGLSIDVLETGDVQSFQNIYLAPARASWLEGEQELPYLANSLAYQSVEPFPGDFAKIEPPSVFRDFRIARVSIFPVQYIPAKNELQVVSSITIRINYGAGEVVNPKISGRKKISPSFAKMYRSFIFNYQNVLDKYYGGKEDDHEVMLCIMPDEFYNSFQPYAEWKRQSGTDIHITKFSDISANSNNPDIIKDHISDAYFNWEIPPTYVLIIGDEGVFPIKIVNYGWSFPNEDYFVEVEGNDFFPEMMIGRFTNQADYRLQVMVNKFLMYERNPYTADTSWFKKGIVCSNNAYESQIETKRFTASVMLEDGHFTSADTLMSDGWGGGCSMDLDDIMDTINQGRSFLNYRGEGWSSGWWADCYPFTTSEVSMLNNGEKFPFVTSIGCGVAMFTTNGGNCFGEEWVQLGSLTEPRGAIAFVGPTSNTHTTYNNKLDKGIYVGMFQEGMDTPGQALLRGKLYVYNVFGSDPNVEYQYKVYCLLGDPSLHVWKDIPLPVNVEHESSIIVGNNQLDFTVTFASNGLPVKNAQVCLAGNEIYQTACTDSLGKIMIEIAPEFEDTLSVTVRGGNVVPYIGTLEILHPQELVEPENDPLIVDLDGNLDGLVNPNENCNITFTLKNWGTLTANDVQATLSVADTNFVTVVSTNAVNFGNLVSGGSFTGEAFQFYVKPNCPVGEVLALQLHISSSTTTWDFVFDVPVTGCQLVYQNLVVNDAGGANYDYRLDPGETGLLVLSIGNMGEDLATNVTGTISTNDPYLSIEDASGAFGTLLIGEASTSMNDYFVVSVDASCPTDYFAEVLLVLSTQDGNYPYEISTTFNLPVSKILTSDYSGPDAYGYFAYTNTDAFYEKTPEYNWIEIEDLGVQINVPNVSDYTETVNLPFSFKYYGVDYTHLRISTDGWMAFGGGQQISPENHVIPFNDNVNNMMAVFWDDLYDITYADEGEIYYYSDIDNHRFIIEWDSITHNGFVSEPKKEVFQAILFDPEFYPTATGDGEIIFQYKNVKDKQSMTIGIENSSQDVGLQYVFNEDYDPTALVLEGQTAIRYTTEAPFIPVLVSIEDSGYKSPVNHKLEQNYPNPFYGNTWINYTISKSSQVIIEIYNVDGELVRVLQNGKQSAGKYSVKWNGVGDFGNSLKSGIYFYRLQTESFLETRKMLMLK